MPDPGTATAAAPRYLPDPAGGPAAFALLHPAVGPQQDTAVLLCPPLGYDDICTYRSLRAWARSLAVAGYPALRLELPGTGDSAGDEHTPGLVGAWVRAIATAAAHLRAETGCARVVAIGIGLGGMLAHEAVARGAAVDDLVLWGSHARGRSYLRELRAFARLGPVEDGAPGWARPLPEGAIEAGGFVIAPDTATDIGALDLTATPLPSAERRHVLLLRRDNTGPDARLEAAVAASGADLSVSDGPGFSLMMDEPNRARPPAATFAIVAAWLAATERDPGPPEAPAAAPVPAPELPLPGGATERARAIPLPAGDLFAIEARAEDDGGPLSVVFLDVGGERRVGANRMWVKAARRWAARGVSSARIDLLGIGDAGGPDSPYSDVWSLYDEELVGQAAAALDDLVAAGLPPRFVMVGMCSSAYWSFRVAMRDRRVVATCLLNPRMLLFDETRGSAAEVRHLRRLVRAEVWRELLRGRLTWARSRRLIVATVRMLGHVPRIVRDRVVARARGGDALDLAFDALRDQGTAVDVVFTPGEPLRGDLARGGHLERLDRWPSMRLIDLDGPSNAHTLQYAQLQEPAHRVIDEAIEAALARLPAAAPTTAGSIPG